MKSTDLTPYADVNVILGALITAVRAILGDQFVGLYLDGSLALGDFNEETSDIDVLVLTAEPLPDELVAALAAMHTQFGVSGSKWGYEMEVSYIPQWALGQLPHREKRFVFPRIERGETLTIQEHHMDWVLHCHILREYGIALIGPPLGTLIEPVAPEAIKAATRDLFNFWWRPMVANPSNLEFVGYRIYAILTMCRMIYTLRHGEIVSKPAAARWAMKELDERWRGLVETAVHWNGEDLDNLAEAVAFIWYVGGEIGSLETGE
jgi:hypothetical protein